MFSLPPPATSGEDHDVLKTSTASQVRAFIIKWTRVNYLDLLWMAIVGGACIALDRAPLPLRRTFPLKFSISGDIIYPELAYPDRGWILSPTVAACITIITPLTIYLLGQIRIRSAWDLSAAVMGTFWAILTATIFQVIIKLLVGGLRPIFLDVCRPDISLAASRNESGLNGVGYGGIMYSTDICTQPNKRKLRTTLTAFPSGHATAAFAGFGFAFLWLNAKLKVWADRRPAFWKLALVVMPLLVAVLIAASLTIDNVHNWSDIVMGSAIGILAALAAYRASYAATWDWRFNHVPLEQGTSSVDGQPNSGVGGQTSGVKEQASGQGTESAPDPQHDMRSALRSAFESKHHG